MAAEFDEGYGATTHPKFIHFPLSARDQNKALSALDVSFYNKATDCNAAVQAKSPPDNRVTVLTVRRLFSTENYSFYFNFLACQC